jgi:hypothetical protein
VSGCEQNVAEHCDSGTLAVGAADNDNLGRGKIKAHPLPDLLDAFQAKVNGAGVQLFEPLQPALQISAARDLFHVALTALTACIIFREPGQ